MSGYWSRLGEKALGASPPLQPLVAPLYSARAPDGASGGVGPNAAELRETTVETEGGARRSRDATSERTAERDAFAWRAPGPAAATRATGTTLPPLPSAPVRIEVVERPDAARSNGVAREPAPLVPRDREPPSGPTLVRAARHDATLLRPPPAMAPALPVEPDATHASEVWQRRDSTTESHAHDAGSEPPPPREPTLPDLDLARILPQLRALGATRAEPSATTRGPTQTVVRVSIGRIEVRVPSTTTPRIVAAPERAAPERGFSLADYLAKRSQAPP